MRRLGKSFKNLSPIVWINSISIILHRQQDFLDRFLDAHADVADVLAAVEQGVLNQVGQCFAKESFVALAHVLYIIHNDF